MSLFNPQAAVTALVNAAQDAIAVRDALRWEAQWHNDTAAATNTAIAEAPAFIAKRACRLVGCIFIPNAAVTGAATNFFSLLVDKRPASAPATPTNLITYAADTNVTDNAVAFAKKDLYASPYKVGAAAAFDMVIDDVLTVEVTKDGTGMTFPISRVVLLLEGRN